MFRFKADGWSCGKIGTLFFGANTRRRDVIGCIEDNQPGQCIPGVMSWFYEGSLMCGCCKYFTCDITSALPNWRFD